MKIIYKSKIFPNQYQYIIYEYNKNNIHKYPLNIYLFILKNNKKIKENDSIVIQASSNNLNQIQHVFIMGKERVEFFKMSLDKE